MPPAVTSADAIELAQAVTAAFASGLSVTLGALLVLVLLAPGGR